MENVSELAEPRIVVEDWNKIAGMNSALERRLWAHLMSTLDGYQKSELNTQKVLSSGVTRSSLWKALKSLEKMGVIQKTGHHWDTVRVNPEVAHVNWLRGDVLKRRIAEYQRCLNA